MTARDRKEREGESRRGRGCAIVAAVVIVLIGLAGLGVDLYDRYWERRFEAKVAELRVAGQPVTIEEVFARREHIPDEENSALILLRAFEEMEGAEPEYREAVVEALLDAARLGTRPSEQARQIIGSRLSTNAKALQRIHEAAAFARGAYPVTVRPNPYETELPHLTPLRAAAKLCALSAASHAAAGQAEEAHRDLWAGLRLGASIGDSPFLMSCLVRVAADWIFADALQRSLALCELPVERLRLLREEMARESGSLSLRPGLLCDRAFAHWLFTSGIRMSELDGGWGYVYRYVPGWSWRDALFSFTIADRQLAVADMPPRQRVREARKLTEHVERELHRYGRRYWISAMIMPALRRAVEEGVKAEVRLQVALTALAAEEWRLAHGRWPDSLEQLVPELLDAVPEDPFSDTRIQYKRTGTGVVVYSVGPDGQDDGGTSLEEARKLAGEDGYLDEGWDLPFRLLNPELRGARALTFLEEILATGINRSDLDHGGLTREKLAELGLTEADLRKLGYR